MTRSKLLIGTSANFSNSPSSRSFVELDPKLLAKCDAVLTKEISPESKGESTIIDISNETSPQIIRLGSLPKDEIVKALNIN